MKIVNEEDAFSSSINEHSPPYLLVYVKDLNSIRTIRKPKTKNMKTKEIKPRSNICSVQSFDSDPEILASNFYSRPNISFEFFDAEKTEKKRISYHKKFDLEEIQTKIFSILSNLGNYL